MYRESTVGGLRRREWHLDGFVVTECGGYFVVGGLDRLPPGWYSVTVGWDEARQAPTLGVVAVGDPDEEHPADVFALMDAPRSDTHLIRVAR